MTERGEKRHATWHAGEQHAAEQPAACNRGEQRHATVANSPQHGKHHSPHHGKHHSPHHGKHHSPEPLGAPHDHHEHGAHRLGTFDANRTYTVEEHHEWALHLWNRMDRDGSGSITRDELNCDEFQDVLHSVIAPENSGEASHAAYGRAEIHIQQALDFCLRKAHLNKDGTLSFKEFKSFMKILRNQSDENNQTHLIFALFDLDGSNSIDKEEFEGIYSFFCGHRPTKDEVNKAFEQMDKHDKKEVTRNQFIRWLKTDAPPAFKHHGGGVEEELRSRSSLSQASGSKLRSLLKPAPKKIHRPAPGMFQPRADSVETWSESWHSLWNERFRGRDPSLHNTACPERLKHYFSAPQTLPELDRFYKTYKGFGGHRKALLKGDPPRPRPVLSTSSSTLEVSRERAMPGGTARNKKGDPVLWDNEWPDKLSDFQQKVAPGSLLLRCPGKPPPILFLGRDADHLAYKVARSRTF